MAVAICVLMKRRNTVDSTPTESSNIEEVDRHNPLYGEYHRGWNGEGEYGDGDQMEMWDTNDYYGT